MLARALSDNRKAPCFPPVRFHGRASIAFAERVAPYRAVEPVAEPLALPLELVPAPDVPD